MKNKEFLSFRHPTPDEQEILTHLVVRPVPAEQVEQFDRLITQHHYLKSAQLVGNSFVTWPNMVANGWL